MKKILVTGSRTGFTYEEVTELFLMGDLLLEPSIFIHGGAPGVDTFVSEFVKNYPNYLQEVVVRPIDPKNKQDYLYRNVEMIGMCDEVVAFWDGKSRGTKFTMDYAQKRGKLVRVVRLK